MKNKKNVIWLALLVFLLAASLLLTSCGRKKPQDPSNQATNTENVENTANTEPNENTENGENTEDGENTEPNENTEDDEDGADIIEDGGDLVVVIPDDQGSGGL